MVIPDFIFEKISKLIYEKTGIVVGVRDKDKLANFFASNKIDPRYLEKELSNNPKLLHDIINVITVNETFFFRHESQFEILENILSEFFRNRKYSRIKIWSVGCSTGEEPYSIAITAIKAYSKLYGSVCDLYGIVEIIANDINREVLDKAIEGKYRDYSIRNVSHDVLREFFEKNGETYVIKDFVKKLVSFYCFSITSTLDVVKYVGVESCDVVFCRNVLIYFDDDSRRKSINNIYKALKKNGYLFLAPTESIRDINEERFSIAVTKGGIIYVKR